MGGQSHASAALPPGKTRYPFYGRLGGPQGRSGRVRKISPPPGFDPHIVQPVASHYTDWAIPAPSIINIHNNKPTSRSRFLDKLTVCKPFKKFSAVCTVNPECSLMTRTERDVLYMSVYSPFNHLTQPLDPGYFTDFSVQFTVRSFLFTSSFTCIYLQNLYLNILWLSTFTHLDGLPGNQPATQLQSCHRIHWFSIRGFSYPRFTATRKKFGKLNR
jgi:hypothetical protein